MLALLTAASITAVFIADDRAADLPLHTTIHPSEAPTATTPGVAGGGTFLWFERAEGVGHQDGTMLSAVAAEGWVRWGGEATQAELRLTPSMMYFSYRVDVWGARDGAMVALIPSMGAGYWRRARVTDRVTHTFAWAPALSVLGTMGSGRFYGALRYGAMWQHEMLSYTDNPTETATTTRYLAQGAVLGTTLRHGSLVYTLELSAIRSQLTGSDDGATAYTIVPSVGVHAAH